MKEPVGERDASVVHHNFYIPNSHPRAKLHTDQQYHAIPDEEAAENGQDDNGSVEGDEVNLTGVGVEISPAWRAMSPTRHALVRIAFGILGATVLLPL